MTIDDTQAAAVLLSTATEGGSGLYEAVWELNSKFPEAPLSEKYRAAAAAIRHLYNNELIELYLEHFAAPSGSRFEKLQPANLDELLENPVTWYPEYDGVQVGFSATQVGMQRYNEQA